MMMMIRSAAITPGKASEAIAYAHAVAAMVKEKTGTTVEVLMPIGGNPYSVGWLARFENVAEWDALGTKLMSDAEYAATTAANAHNFIAGSLHDDLWRSI